MTLHWKLLSLLCVAVFLLHIFQTHAGVISNSKIELCDRTSADDAELQCSEKITMSLAINQGERDEIQYTLNEVDGQQIEEPLAVVVRKTVPKLLYPVYYVRDFNANPFERIV